jgi:hypothetical protein
MAIISVGGYCGARISLARTHRIMRSGLPSQMAFWQANPLAFFISGIEGSAFPARQFLLKCLEMDELQAVRLRRPDRVALRVFVEQAERFCWREIVTHRNLHVHPILPAATRCFQ